MTEAETLRVLVLDDEPFMLRLIAEILRQLGFSNVRCARDGQEALAHFTPLPLAPQLVLLDLNMPGMDGVEFIRALAACRYGGALILVSGEDTRVIKSVEKLARAHGMTVLGHLQKPVDPQALAAMIATLRSAGADGPGRTASTEVYNSKQLRAALERGELLNHYQPKVAVSSGAFVGVEVLVRWRHPHDGLVSPEHFIGIAEESGLIGELTDRVLANALAQARVWRDAGLVVRLAVNVSMNDLNTLQFPEHVEALVNAAGVATHELLLEVTESRLMRDLRSVLDILPRLRLKRFGIAIDDFGTGHSSLGQLRDLPFDQLKVDKGFVHGAHADPTLLAIYNASLAMARQLGMEVVAEGVEDRADWDMLRRTGCDIAQGYFIARPMPGEALGGWLADWRERLPREDLLGVSGPGA